MASEEKSRKFTHEEMDEIIEKCRAVEDAGELGSERVYSLIKRYFSPTVVGLENLPEEPTLFVGNHSMFGLDGWILMPTLYYETGRFVRAMGDNAWLANATIGDTLINNGMILGHPRACAAMMEDGHDLLVFPGGAAEANKTAEQKYSLQWRERFGFIRLAAEHGYNITPFGLVGPDDCYDHLFEGDELLDSPLGKLLGWLGVDTDGIREDILPPIPSGMFSSLLPKPQACYLAFGEPVEMPKLGDEEMSESLQRSLREEVAKRVDGLIRDMLLLRSQRRQDEGWLRRLLTR
ncbi:MAG: lysophospholipid acyltransferase family protein [Myxococcota bacterium]|jgi:1-acyl-sn-glycerol-3-phosphate acyltransferase|nr:lysophospholipid acyltransferase family protein [Myxococcota bacterium]